MELSAVWAKGVRATLADYLGDELIDGCDMETITESAVAATGRRHHGAAIFPPDRRRHHRSSRRRRLDG